MPPARLRGRDARLDVARDESAHAAVDLVRVRARARVRASNRVRVRVGARVRGGPC